MENTDTEKLVGDLRFETRERGEVCDNRMKTRRLLIVSVFLATTLPQLPYSPDMVPANFSLFQRFKRTSKGTCRRTLEAIKVAMTTTLKEIPVAVSRASLIIGLSVGKGASNHRDNILKSSEASNFLALMLNKQFFEKSFRKLLGQTLYVLTFIEAKSCLRSSSGDPPLILL